MLVWNEKSNESNSPPTHMSDKETWRQEFEKNLKESDELDLEYDNNVIISFNIIVYIFFQIPVN